MLLEASGLKLHALERNPSGRPAVLFLHGWLDHAHSFDWLCEALPASWRTLAIDFRGHGESEHLHQGHYHFTDYLADVEAAARALGAATEPIHLVGHSMGGAVATVYAAARPEWIRSLTTIESLGPVGSPIERVVPRLQGFVEELHKPLQKRTYPSLEAAAQRVRENNSGLTPAAAELLARYGTREVEGGRQFTFDPLLRHTSALAFDETQALEALGGVKCRVLVIHGSHGFSFDDAQMAERLRRLGSPTPVEVDGGHHVHLDRPREVAAVLRPFVEAAMVGEKWKRSASTS